MNYALVNGIILDGTKDMVPKKGHTILVENGIIKDIIQANNQKYEGYKVIDLKGFYILPGLINLHAHLAISGKPPKKEKKINYKKLFDTLSKIKLVMAIFKKLNANYAKTELLSGVTTLRAVGGILDLDARNRDDINAGKILGPRIICANRGISVPNGHFAGSIATEARSVDEVIEHVRLIASTKPDLIKLMITGGVMDAEKEGEPGILRMNLDMVKAACDEAHKLGYKVSAHVESTKGVEVALLGGVDTIEHGAKIDGDIIKLFKEKKAVDVCTISPAIPYTLFSLEESHAPKIGKTNGKIIFDGIVSCAKTCLENNIPVGLGNDVGCHFITHYSFWRELYYFHKYVGVSNNFALHSATLNNAKILGLDKITGSIEKGKSADMIVVKNNPLENLQALRNVTKVMIEGKLINSPRIKRMKQVDKLLDKYM